MVPSVSSHAVAPSSAWLLWTRDTALHHWPHRRGWLRGLSTGEDGSLWAPCVPGCGSCMQPVPVPPQKHREAPGLWQFRTKEPHLQLSFSLCQSSWGQSISFCIALWLRSCGFFHGLEMLPENSVDDPPYVSQAEPSRIVPSEVRGLYSSWPLLETRLISAGVGCN